MTRCVRIYKVKLRNISSVIICVFLIASETPAFAVAVLRREGVTIGGGDGSSFEKAIIVHAAYLPQALFAGFEYVALRYGWFQISSGSIVKYKGKSYKVISYEDHRAMGDPKPKRVLYFDVSEYLPTYSFPQNTRVKRVTRV